MVYVTRAWEVRNRPEYSMDLNLVQRAHQAYKLMAPLDDDETRPGTCSDLVSSGTIVNYFTASGEDLVAMLDRLIEVYRSGDEKQLEKMLAETVTNPDVEKWVLMDRNIRWFNKIHHFISKENVKTPPFFAVGAGHLIGPGNLLELFRKNGYLVRRITKE